MRSLTFDSVWFCGSQFCVFFMFNDRQFKLKTGPNEGASGASTVTEVNPRVDTEL